MQAHSGHSTREDEMADYSIWLLEYARATEQPVGSVLAGMFNQGSLIAPFCYAVIKGEGHVAMVDVGYDYAGHNKYLADISGCSLWQPPENVLPAVGIQPGDVDTIFITHAHFDHMGHVRGFRNAHFFIQERELNKWMWALSLPERFGWVRVPVNPQDVYDLCELTKQQRLTLVDGVMNDVLPGISLLPAHDTHSFGCQYVAVENESDAAGVPWVFVGDNLFSYQNVRGIEGNGVYVPSGLCHCGAIRSVVSIDALMQRVGNQCERLIIFHEKESWNVFPSWQGPHGLHIAEVCLAPGERSLVP
jgi:glyoxylase-like metal-dependent hydrolase (beta-lactamase superfamily II)